MLELELELQKTNQCEITNIKAKNKELIDSLNKH